MALALVMIVRDEARCLERCLASVRPIVDEIVVLDTGSTDATLSIARSAGARLGHFDWCEDFARARNAALDLADADWNLILDADNWLIHGGGLDDIFKQPPFIGVATIENQIEIAGAREIATAAEARLLPRGVRYSGCVHEQPITALPRRSIDVVLGHDGYLSEQRTRKGKRNELLLLERLRADPKDAYVWYQLAREYDADERYDQAKIAVLEAVRLVGAATPWRPNLMVRAIHILTRAGALQEALALAQLEDGRWQTSPDWHFTLGALFLECASQDQSRAIDQWLPFAETRWKRCLEIGETPGAAGAVRGRGGHLAAHNLAALYASFGSPDQALRYEVLASRLRAAA